jgi:hypothetical protein
MKVDFRSKKILKKLNTNEAGDYLCPACNKGELMINHLSGQGICLDGCNEQSILEAINKPILKPKSDTKSNQSLSEVLGILLEQYRKDIRYNILLNQYELFNRDPYTQGYSTFIPLVLDTFVITVAIELGITLSDSWASKAVQYIGNYNLYNPIATYLKGLDAQTKDEWMILRELLGINSDIELQIVGGWLYGCVMRAYQPGCKNDLVLILQGKQGIGKSSFFQIMGGEWFSDQFNDITAKDDKLNVIRNWIVEWAELSVFHSARQSIIDSYVTARVDTIRKPYGKELMDYKRIACFGGSTNETTFFDTTREHRRYGVVQVNNIDLVALKENRDRIWDLLLLTTLLITIFTYKSYNPSNLQDLSMR